AARDEVKRELHRVHGLIFQKVSVKVRNGFKVP
ncbi:MAG: hypothetical protein PWP30_2379, partial [Eubacteriaceae bacterium]|nr:hypothetical protein [Eubacteriaceae bacterium]